MNQLKAYCLAALPAICIHSCTSPNKGIIEKIDAPDLEKTRAFQIEIPGEITYQFYHKYGFTDVEEQLILLVKADNPNFLTSDLPFESSDIIKIQKIDMRKFVEEKPVNFEPEKTLQADIRLEAREFDSGQDKSVFHNQGRYKITVNDSIETLYVFDSKKKLLYIESKKKN